MINDYHGMRIQRNLKECPDEMIHSVANDVELAMLEAKIKPESIAYFYESLRRQEPKIHGVMVTDRTGAEDSIG